MKEVSVGILISPGKILACQRKRTTRYPLKWEFPGGKVEPGETPHIALVRELQEELALDVHTNGEYHRQEWDYGDQSYRVYYFLVREFTGEMENRTFEQCIWVTPAEMLRMDILEGNRGVLEMLAELDEFRNAR